MWDIGGRHEASPTRPGWRELLPWLPTGLGVCTLIALLVVAGVRFATSPEPPPPAAQLPLLPVPPPLSITSAPPLPIASGPVRPSASALPAAPPTARPSVATTSPNAAGRPPPRTSPPPPPAVTGRYRVVESFGDGFIGEVLVGNSSGRDRDWQVALRFPAPVGQLYTSWVESAPQATLRRSGDTYLWSSGAPVAARGSVQLRFHFAREGSGNTPSSCSVNDVTCDF